MNKIFGYRDNDSVKVTVDKKTVQLAPSLKVFPHSPSGFEVGYGRSGPAQLALAILMMFTDNETAVKLHHKFKWEFIANHEFQDKDIFEFEVDIRAWIVSELAKR